MKYHNFLQKYMKLIPDLRLPNVRIVIALAVMFVACSWIVEAKGPYDILLRKEVRSSEWVLQDTIPGKKNIGKYLTEPEQPNPFDLKDPPLMQREVEYDENTNTYNFIDKLGEDYGRYSPSMTFSEYLEYRKKQQEQSYMNLISGITPGGGLDLDPMERVDVSKNLADRLFGGSNIDIRPRGNIDITLGYEFQHVENPILLERQQRYGGLDFDMPIRLDVDGNIGDKLNLKFNWDNKSTFNFDQNLKINYDTDKFSEDEIIKTIDAGYVSLPLNSQLIQGSQNLFGVKLGTQFGRLRLTTILSQQNSETKDLNIQGGGEVQQFEVEADSYDENRHFFLSHYFRDHFEESLEFLPQIRSMFKVTKLEVWITNDRNQSENARDVLAIADLGETEKIFNTNPSFQNPPVIANPDITGNAGLPDNSSNAIYETILANNATRNLDRAVAILSSQYRLQQARDFEKVGARLLRGSEYQYDPDLGYISLNTALRPDQVLAVSFEYEYNGEKYQVGEFSKDLPMNPDTTTVIFTKLLKGTTQQIRRPIWDLMMKNIYSIGAYQVSQEDFRLDIFYEDPGKSLKRYLPAEGFQNLPLLNLFNLDNLTTTGDPQPGGDGQFDFVNGVTFNLSTGRMMFPVLEPFGLYLEERLGDPELSEKFAYNELYDSTLVVARENTEKNRFLIKGEYKASSSDEYDLRAFNVPRGSVKVYAGSQRLVEGVDYEVNYGLGKVRITNSAYTGPGVNVRVEYEDQGMFNLNRKNMVGLRADYAFSDELNVGATYMHLWERPFTQKVNYGEDPINNRIIGLDMNLSKPAPWLTRMLDKVPLINTTEESSVDLALETAWLKPGHSRAIDVDSSGGTAYLDDFEGSSTGIDLRLPTTDWVISSVPQNDINNNNPRFPESALINNVLSGVNRAQMSWYRLESDYANNSNPYTRAVGIQEIFPNREIDLQFASTFLTFDVMYDPTKRGPYNFDVPGGTDYSAGLDPDGELVRPESRWGGMMRALQRSDFESANVEYIEMWVLNPYMEQPDGSRLQSGGKIHINLGEVSEDIVKDGRMFFENGLPVPGSNAPLDTTNLGVVPRLRNITRSFDANPKNRERQDVGFDGLSDEGERVLFSDYLQQIQSLNAHAREAIESDPSNDNYMSHRSYPDNYDDVLGRFERVNGTEGNSRINEGRQMESSTNKPDNEDINGDNTLNESESYFQYEIPIEYDPSTGGIEQMKYITDTINSSTGVWYRLKIPIQEYKNKVGSIDDFRSIRFIRMYMTGFESRAIFRFAKFELVNNTWRRYTKSLSKPGIGEPNPIDKNVEFDVNVVNIEENSGKFPFQYKIPPGVKREVGYATVNSIAMNEQSIALNVCDLPHGDAVAIYKIIGKYDLRDFERLKMFVHAEEKDGELRDGDLSIFMRIGSDFSNNYYEYEVPLTISRIENLGPPNSLQYVNEVWRKENNFNFLLELLKNTKMERNAAGASETTPFERTDPENPNNKVKVMGNPTLGNPKSIMIGIRNNAEDRLNKCAEVWVNELRMQGLNEDGGMAALARLDVQLADFGRLNFASNFSSVGWGSLDQKLVERQKEQLFDYNVSANLELSKLLPDKWNVSIPFFAQYSNATATPQYDPYDNDLTLKEKLETVTPEERDSVRDQAIIREVRKTVSFDNVRVMRADQNADRKPMPWDVDNFSVSYSKTTSILSDPVIEEDKIEQQRGALDYNYSAQPLYITPLENVISNDKFLKFLTEFNFNPIPSSVSIRNELNRFNSTTLYRFMESEFSDWYTKRFTWDRDYNLSWNLTRSLRLNFDAMNNSVVDELPVLDENRNPYEQEAIRDTLWSNLSRLGRPKNYQHKFNLTYALPFKYFPMLDFIDVGAQMATTYTWSAAARNAVDDYGNIIQNSQTRSVNANINFVNLYNKLGYLKSVNDYRMGRESGGADARSRQRPGSGQNQGRGEGSSGPGMAEVALLRPLMAIRNLKFNYTENLSSVVPGFKPQPRFMGMDKNWNSPGLGYILGIQPTDSWLDGLVTGDNNYITRSVVLNQEVIRNRTQRYDASLDVEPFRDFKVNLIAKKDYTRNNFEFFKVQQPGGEFAHLSPRDIGSYNISFFSLNTFMKTDTTNVRDLFHTFETNRAIISERLGDGRPHEKDGENYDFGYGRYQSEVLIPAFLSAYTDKDPLRSKMQFLDVTPKLNWSLSYNGLNKIPFFDELFSSFSLRHGYISNLNINSFRTDRDFNEDPLENINDLTGNYYSRYEIPDVVITEQFNPLIGLEVRTRNDINFSVDYIKSRNLNLSLTNYQLNENNSSEIVFGFGSKFKNVSLPFGNRERKRPERPEPGTVREPQSGRSERSEEAGNDILLQMDFSIGDNLSIIHLFDSDVQPQVSSGARTISFRPTVDYELSDKMTIRLYGEYNKTVPWTSNSYPITRFRTGTTIRYKLD